MADLNPWRTGAALALTITVGYTACALVFGLWPELAAPFLKALFHGLDFSKLETGVPWSWAGFASALLALVVWGFLVGALFAWFCNRLGRGSHRA